MKRSRIVSVSAAAGVAAAMVLTLAPSGTVVAATGGSTPLWVTHVQKYSGGLSGTVRSYASGDVAQAQARYANAPLASSSAAATTHALNNVQMDQNTNPPLPQNETSVAVSLANPNIAVAGSNDYVGGGVTVMYTSDGGATWGTIRVTPQFDGTRDYCNGGDPWFAYSKRDHAFYFVQLCFFRSQAYSEVQLYKSVDNGHTWTPGRQSGLVASNYDYANGTVDESFFLDNNQVTIDNNLGSPHYGRIYITYVKFHFDPSGFGDYCPVQLGYTDDVPTFNPRLTVFQHTPVVPDQPGGPGGGPLGQPVAAASG